MLTDLIGGQVQVAINGVSSVEMIRAGRLRALGVASAARLEALPEIEPIAESVAGFEASGFCGIVAPLTDVGVTVLAGSPLEFAKLIADETEKWAKVIKFAGIKAD
jgi:tripartite-type tricarboxylate transporter receptor subunit TctC